ncbi:MAG: VOC family protein [Gammaproteobacteria bacterium]
MTPSRESDDIAERLLTALAALDFASLSPVLSSDVQFGSCVGRAQVIEYLGRIFSRGITIDSSGVEAHPDRLITVLELKSSEPEFGPRRQYAVAFTRDGVIVELQVTADRDQALAAVQSPSPPARPLMRTRLNALAAVLPVRDLGAALEHYGRLGFSVRAYEGGGYGYAERDGLNLHLTAVPDLDPAATTSAVYLYVDDADAMYAEWRSSGVSGQFFAPHDTEYGLREGAHVDRDGNLIRFGSRLSRVRA